MKEYSGHKYYGELVIAERVIDKYEESGEEVLSTNGIQGIKGVEFLMRLVDIVGIDVYLDVYCDRSDTIFIEINKVSKSDILRLMSYIFKVKPDEFRFNDKMNVLRIWWD